ncbi:MAG: flagellar motor switch protein FliM [Nitrospinota bacterium]
MSTVLSQEEIDALLRGINKDATQGEESLSDGGEIESYDLTNQERIVRGRMPTLDIINQRFTRLFRNSLSTSLRKVVDIAAISTETVKFSEFIRSLPMPTSLHVFKIEPLRGFALLVAESKLVFALVDIFFGGSGMSKMKIEGRDFTMIEQRMIRKVILMTLADMELAWKPVHDVSLNLIRSEVNPQFAAIVPPTDVVVIVIFEVELDTLSGLLTICLPYSTIEPIMTKLRAGFQSDQLEIDQAWVNRLRGRLSETEVEVVAMLGETNISGDELINLKKGDVIGLNKDVDDDLTLYVEGIPKFKGKPGLVKSNRAIKVTTILNSAIKKLSKEDEEILEKDIDSQSSEKMKESSNE